MFLCDILYSVFAYTLLFIKGIYTQGHSSWFAFSQRRVKQE